MRQSERQRGARRLSTMSLKFAKRMTKSLQENELTKSTEDRREDELWLFCADEANPCGRASEFHDEWAAGFGV
jgi:hypothetical protein